VSRSLAIRSLRIASLALLASAFGCDVREDLRDTPQPFDTTLTEGGIIRDDTSAFEDAPGADAGRDAGNLACESECDPRLLADGCIDEMRCVLSSEEPACSDAFGTAEVGEACTALDACAPGLACFRAARTAGGVCGQICCPGEGTLCDGTARCGGDGMLVDGTSTAWGRCVPPRSCSVLAPELTCEAREGCYIVDGVGGTECRLLGTGVAGDACTAPEDCGGGLFCGGLSERTCLVVCSLTMTSACTSGERCVAQTYSPEGTGICVASAGARP
jgi:hypothetical protein